MIAFIGLIPLFAGPGDTLLAQQALYLGLLALSLNLLVDTTGLISFGHAMFWAFGGYLVAVSFTSRHSCPVESAVRARADAADRAVAGFVIGLVVFRGRELYFSLLTLGVGQLVWAIAHGWQSLTGGTNGANGVFAARLDQRVPASRQAVLVHLRLRARVHGDALRHHEVAVRRRAAREFARTIAAPSSPASGSSATSSPPS